jgi:hypothetical protein
MDEREIESVRFALLEAERCLAALQDEAPQDGPASTYVQVNRVLECLVTAQGGLLHLVRSTMARS